MGVSANMEAPHYLRPCVNEKVVIRIEMRMVVIATKIRGVAASKSRSHA